MADDVLPPPALSQALAPRYLVERVLGVGGMATVYLAHDSRHDRRVAIKVLRDDISGPSMAARFHREIQVTARLTHPHVVALLDSGEANGGLFYVMPFVEGESLRERLSREVQLDLSSAVAVTRDVAGALAYAHRQGVLHRDIKPENILMADGHALVADFGIAAALESVGGERLTATGISIGSPAYMSPEQALSDRVLDERSDQYSLACVTYEMLAGEPPFTGPNAQALIVRRVTEVPRSVRAARPALPQQVDDVLQRALATTPADRFPSVMAFSDALAAAAAADVSASGVTASPQRGRGLGFRSALVVGAIVVAAAAVALVISQRAPGRRGAAATDGAAPPRVAVLPLENLSAAGDQAFAAGVTEEIVTRLAAINSMRVVSRSGARRMQADDGSSALGTTLHADYVLEGSVRMDRSAGGPGAVRVIARLVRARDDVQVWDGTFDAAMTPGDIFAVQATIATRVAAALKISLNAGEARRIAKVATRDSSAYRAYQAGRFQWEKRDQGSLERAREQFHQAVARDSGFAEAYVGIGDAESALLLLYGQNLGAEAEAAYRRALVLDTALAAGHAGLGYLLLNRSWEWSNAELELRRAIALDPGYAPAHYWLTQLLWVRERLPEALDEARTSVALDPLSVVSSLAYARSLRLTDPASPWPAELRHSIELEPGLWVPYGDLAEYFARRGDTANALDATRGMLRYRFPGRAVRPATVDAVSRTLGGHGVPRAAARMLRDDGIDVPAITMARWFALNAQPDSAFGLLKESVRTRSPDVPVALPFLAEYLHRDSRWAELRRAMGLLP